MFRRLDDPYEDDFSGGNGAVAESGDEISNVWDLMRDAHTAREDHDGAVGVKTLKAAVRAFDKSVEDEAALGILGFLV